MAGRRQQNRNLRCLRTPSGQLVFEAERAVAPGEELVAGFSQEEEDKEAEQDASSILANALMLRAISSLVTGKQGHCGIFIFFAESCAHGKSTITDTLFVEAPPRQLMLP